MNNGGDGGTRVPLVNAHRDTSLRPVVRVDRDRNAQVVLPDKVGDIEHALFDSRKWALVPYRHDDVVIASYPKSGTTWMQQIVRCLLHHNNNLLGPLFTMDHLSPWIDYRNTSRDFIIRNVVNSPLTTRRFLKTHLPLDALPTSTPSPGNGNPDSSSSSNAIVPAFIYIARDGRDVVWSFYNHHRSYTPEHVAAMSRAGWKGQPFPDFVAENLSPTQYFQRWLENDGYPLWPFFHLVKSWWDVRNHPKVLLVHYNNLIRDRAAEIHRIQSFLAQHGAVAIETKHALETAVRESAFDAMKAAGNHIAPLGGKFLQQGSNSFFNKGTNGRWKNTLPPELSSAYEDSARKELGPECAHWLASGEMR